MQRSLQSLLRSSFASSCPAWRSFCTPPTEPEAQSASDASTPPAAAQKTKRGPYKLTKLLSSMDDFGKGRRFKKVYWDEGSFWHVVDVKVTEKEDPANGVTTALKRVSGVRFKDNMPQTGRVSRIRHAERHEWVPLSSS